MPFLTPVIEDSPLNFVQFVDAEFAQHPSIHSLYAGQDWEEKTYAPGQYKIPYKYPAEIADPIALQFHCSYISTAIPTLRMFKVVGKGNGHIAVPFYTFPTPSYTYVTGNAATLEGGVVEPLATFWWNGAFTQIPGITAGVYYLVLTMGYSSMGAGAGPIDRYHSKKSGHIELKFRHNGTIGITAKNNTNDHDTIFVQTQFAPFARMNGALLEYAPDSEDTSYTNQNQKLTKLYSKPGYTKTLVIGGKRGIPQWVKAWTNYAMSCDYKAVNGIEITKDEGSQWEPISAGGLYPLGGQSMTVREADPFRRYRTVIKGYVTLYMRPATLPYMITRVALHRTGFPVITLGTNFAIRSLADEQRMLLLLQAEAVRQGLKGYVSFVGNELRYINHYTEQYDVSDTSALTKVLSVAYSPSFGATLTMSIDATYVGVDWGDGGNVSYGTGSVASYTPSHAYAGSTPVMVSVFHNGSSLRKFSTSSSVGVTSIDGIASSAMTEFQVQSAQLTSFKASILSPSAATLEVFNIRNNKITALPNFLSTLTAAGAGMFAALNDVAMNGNRLSIPVVDEVIDAVYQVADGANINGGVLSVDLQVPAAHPSNTAPGSPYDELINTYGWIVNID